MGLNDVEPRAACSTTLHFDLRHTPNPSTGSYMQSQQQRNRDLRYSFPRDKPNSNPILESHTRIPSTRPRGLHQSTMSPNLSLYSIPAYYALAMVPHVYSVIVVGKNKQRWD